MTQKIKDIVNSLTKRERIELVFAICNEMDNELYELEKKVKK